LSFLNTHVILFVLGHQ